MISRDAFRVVEGIEGAETLGAVAHALREFAKGFGYDRFVLFSVAKGEEAAIDRVYWAEGDWFSDGTAVNAETYMRRCPVTRHVFETSEPFFWTKLGAGPEELYAVVERPRRDGLHGLQIPVFGPAGLKGAASLGGYALDAGRSAVLALSVVATAAMLRAISLNETTERAWGSDLTKREREVLNWVAAGRRQADIAATLGLSERTIENHLRRIRRKLGARTTAEAVQIAVRIGAIAS